LTAVTEQETTVRTLMLWCPDWPVTAAGLIDGVDTYAPVAVLHANRVLACSAAARAEGVRRGLRKREAQARCPQLVVIEHDPARDARAFEPVVAAVEELTPGVEVIRPGVCAVAAKGPVGYYGGEEQAAERLVEHIALHCGVVAQAGIADGPFAALLAARCGQLVPPGATAEFLAGMDISTLDRPELVDLLRRLGIRTLGDFAALPAGDVLARFGFDAAYAHQLAAGKDDRPLAVRSPPPDLVVTGEYDPPLERVDMAAFAARVLADRLHERLAAYGLAATRLGIEARTAAGEELHRVWRHDGLLDAAAIADRVRWQLDGWLTGSAIRLRAHGGVFGDPDARTDGPVTVRPTAGIDRLRLIPDGLVRCSGMQPGLWGELGEADARAHRALHRVQGLLGPESVYTAVLGGGRGYAERVRLVPWGDERKAEGHDRPWPGRMPAPAPATVLPDPTPVTICTPDGAFLQVDERLALSGPPATVRLARGPGGADSAPMTVTGWAGPWPVDERWWAPDEANQSVRLQLAVADGSALLVAGRGDTWWLEAVYD
jgi:Nucleotidyltransferase/DNA polymerase involved in DNA repair